MASPNFSASSLVGEVCERDCVESEFFLFRNLFMHGLTCFALHSAKFLVFGAGAVQTVLLDIQQLPKSPMQDGRFIAHVHQPPALLDLIDDEWRAESLGHGACFPPNVTHFCPALFLIALFLATACSRADDFDLPTTDLDSDNDEVRAVPKRNDEEKWTELCLDEFVNPRRHAAPR